jgi:hypothetical protein
MNAYDIDRGAPPQTHGSGRWRSSTRPWGAANPPRPHPLPWQGGPGLARGGGARSGLTRGSPPQADPGPTRAPPTPAGGESARRGPAGRATGGRRPASSAPDRGGRPPIARGGQGPAIWWLLPLCQASPAPSLGRAAKFWGQCSLHCPPCPKIRKNHRGSITFFLQLQFKKKKIPSKVLHWPTFH